LSVDVPDWGLSPAVEVVGVKLIALSLEDCLVSASLFVLLAETIGFVAIVLFSVEVTAPVFVVAEVTR